MLVKNNSIVTKLDINCFLKVLKEHRMSSGGRAFQSTIAVYLKDFFIKSVLTQKTVRPTDAGVFLSDHIEWDVGTGELDSQ